MNAEQKQRAVELLAAWQATAYALHADRMVNLLQEMVDAPEPEPVARVTGYYGGYLSIATVDGMVLPAGTALYAAPPAPIVPDGWKLVPVDPTQEMMRSGANVPLNKAARHNAVYRAMLAAAPTPAEAQADVARDAERLDWLDERNAPHGLGWEIIQMPAGNVHIHTLTGDKAKFGSIREAIDAAMSEKGGA